MMFEKGDIVVAVLHSPREKLLAKIDSIDPAGIFVRSIDLGYFDDWCRGVNEGGDHLTMSDNFYPMWRVERVTKDEGDWSVPSMAEQFETRTGQRLADQ
jgi:hypothetical protein